MPSHLMTPYPAVFYHFISGTLKLICKTDYPFFQTCRCCNDLKCAPRLIGIVDTSVSPHLIQSILLLLIRHIFIRLFFRIQLKRPVQIEFRNVYHRIYFPVLRIHKKNCRFFRLLFLPHFFRHLHSILLHIIIQTDL